MTKEQAIKIIKGQQLKNYNIGDGQYRHENEVGIYINDGHWIVYATDERASIVTGSERIFDTEGDAWDNFIQRLIADKILNEY